MCLIAFSYQTQPGYPLVLLANRDEFHRRQTTPLAFWQDQPAILGGRDQQAGGSWLAVSRNGRFAALTNLRRPHQTEGTRSRGLLIKDYLDCNLGSEQFLEQLNAEKQQYSAFNLLVGDFATDCQLWHLSSESDPCELAPGNYALSNEVLGNDWPKTRQLRTQLEQTLTGELDEEALLKLLEDRQLAATEQLPDTGVGEDMERLLSPVFIANPVYGTRCSTFLAINHKGFLRMREHTWDDQQRLTDNRSVELQIQSNCQQITASKKEPVCL